MTIELATPKESAAGHTKRSPAQQRQQQLYQTLGTLARTKGTLEQIARPTTYHNGNSFIKITALQQRVIDAAAYVLSDMMAAAKEEMKQLPNKKRLKELAQHRGITGL